MVNLAEVNEAAKGHTDFCIRSFDGHRLVVVGSFDLCYYHYIELHFEEVAHIDCPVWFDRPQFSDDGPISDVGSSITEPRRFVIRSDQGRHEIIARRVRAVLGMVQYGDRVTQAPPGERSTE